VFERASDLRQKIDLPILGVVSLVLSDSDKRSQRFDRVKFLAASSMLFIAFGAVMVATTIVPRS